MNTYLETGIAVILIIVVFSIVAYVIQELIAVNLQFRGKMLKRAINLLLVNGSTFSDAFFNHPQIKLLQKNGKDPSYISSANFAMALMDLMCQQIPVNPQLKGLFASWEAIAKTDMNEMKALIEKWYDEYMDRVIGWYKKENRWVTRLIAIGLALGFNLNLISLTQTVHKDAALRAVLVAAGEKMADNPDALKQYYAQTLRSKLEALDTIKDRPVDADKEALIVEFNTKQVKMARDLIDSLPTGKLALGWKHLPWKIQRTEGGPVENIKGWDLVFLLIGLFMGAVAISMGAPFWFDLLGKLVNIRRAGIKPPVTT